jgi:LemA protein
MTTIFTVFAIIAAISVIVGVWFIGSYNRLVHLRAMTDEAWSGIDVQLKRRYDLIPNLVETVRGYKIHEQSVLEQIAKMRSMAIHATTIGQKSEAENQLTGALKTLFAVSENYPNLKVNENFLALQKELSLIEDELQLSRRYYNGAVRNYTIAIISFPMSIVASLTGFKAREYFVIHQEERKNPHVTL